MVLLGGGGGSASGPLPPLGHTTARRDRGPGSAPIKKPKSLGPRILELSKQLGQSEARVKAQVCSELWDE